MYVQIVYNILLLFLLISMLQLSWTESHAESKTGQRTIKFYDDEGTTALRKVWHTGGSIYNMAIVMICMLGFVLRIPLRVTTNAINIAIPYNIFFYSLFVMVKNLQPSLCSPLK